MTSRLALPCLLLAALLCPRAAAEDGEPPRRPFVRDEVVLATVVSDPIGDATRLAGEALTWLADEQIEQAYEAYVTLAEQHAEVLLPVSMVGAPRPGRTDGALRWPAYLVANRALARLPAALRERVAERWAPRIRGLAERARLGDWAAVERLAGRFGVTPAGSRALLRLADRDIEAGLLTAAARRLEAWLDLNEEAPVKARAAVALRLADALAALDDAGGMAGLQVRERSLRDVLVRAGGASTTLATRFATWRAARHQRRVPAAKEAPSRSVPALSALEPPKLLWSRSLRDPDLLRQEGRQTSMGVRAGLWGRGEALVINEGRTVRRLDLETGLERWRFPRLRQATIHAPRERYQRFDMPWRAVTPAGVVGETSSVLVVLGDPTATGRYKFLDQEFEAELLGQECRLRLACLDLETGALLWHSGAVDERHPILSHPGTGCASPPLVVGDKVYCIFSKRFGATTFHLACLDRHTGRPLWVSRVAGGESGRVPDQSLGRDRFTRSFARSVPWGGRPVLANGELCVVPHAGLAAGVSVRDGALRWVRALPRYALDLVVPAEEGHSVRNEALAFGDAWILAPMDSPRLLCLAQGTGDLRWQRGQPSPADAPSWRDLLGIQRDAGGAARLRLSGWGPMLMDPADGSLIQMSNSEDWAVYGGDPRGRALDEGPYVLQASAQTLQGQRWAPPSGSPAAMRVLELPSPGCPDAGDLYRVGEVLLLVGQERLVAFAQPALLRGEAPSIAPRTAATKGAPDPARHAALTGLRARLDLDPALFASAVRAALALEDSEQRARLFETLVAQGRDLLASLEGIRLEGSRLGEVAQAVAWMPSEVRGVLQRDLARRLLKLERYEEAARLLIAWIRTADDTLVPLASAGVGNTSKSLRGDLLAAALLREHAWRDEVQGVLAEREGEERERLSVAAKFGDEALRAALRLAVGTDAAAEMRRTRMTKLAESGWLHRASALAADLRLDPPWRTVAHNDDARLREAARLQMDEAGWLAEVGAGQRARTLLADLERWGPGGLKDGRGRTQSVLRAALQERFGWHPYRAPNSPRTFKAWREVTPAGDRDELRSIEFLGLTGPGADALAAEFVLLVRGLTLEIWSRKARRRMAVLRGQDEGWFGGSLRSVDGWVPGGGILVSSVVAGEPADLSGVQGGDWVRSWNGRPVPDLPAFMQLVASSQPGAEIPIGVWRDGQRVLERFRAGRRPSSQGRLVNYPPLWVDLKGRVLVPGRTGLSRVDARAGTRTDLWRWTERGVVRRLDVLAGMAFVTVQRGLLPDVVVAVDIRTGLESWRQEIRGQVVAVKAVGSALWIQTQGPAQALLVDRFDGRPRALLRCFDLHRQEFRKNWEPAAASAAAAGRLAVVQGTDDVHQLLQVNTTTGRIEYRDAWVHGSHGRFGRYINPQVAASAFVSVVRAGGLRLYFPDPLGGAPRHIVNLGADDLLSGESHRGPIDADARVYLRGRTVYVVRLPMAGRRQVSTTVFGVSYEGLQERDPTDQGGGGRVFHFRTEKGWMAGSSDPSRYVLNIRPTFEGILVCAAQLTGEHVAEHYWIAALADGSAQEKGSVRLLNRGVQEARRHAPVRIGRHLFVPTDEGADVFPVRLYRGD